MPYATHQGNSRNHVVVVLQITAYWTERLPFTIVSFWVLNDVYAVLAFRTSGLQIIKSSNCNCSARAICSIKGSFGLDLPGYIYFFLCLCEIMRLMLSSLGDANSFGCLLNYLGWDDPIFFGTIF